MTDTHRVRVGTTPPRLSALQVLTMPEPIQYTKLVGLQFLTSEAFKHYFTGTVTLS